MTGARRDSARDARSMRLAPCGRIRTALLAVGLAAIGACGGGSAPPPVTEEPSNIPPGIQGTSLNADVALGRVAEQEPNNARSQAYALPPVPPRTLLEVAGSVGVSDGWFGHQDPVDAYRFRALVPQNVRLTLDFLPEDPLGSGPNELDVTLFAEGAATAIKSVRGTVPPLVLDVRAEAGRTIDVVVTSVSGHAWYVMGFAGSDTSDGGGPASAVQEASSPSPVAACPSGDCSASHVLVRLRSGADPQAVAERLGLEVAGRTGAGSLRLRLPPSSDTRLEAAAYASSWSTRLGADADVAWAEPDWVVRPLADPGDPDLARQWNLRAIGAPIAWRTTRGDPDIVVGIIDTGIVSHPDLDDQQVPGYDFVSDSDRAGDGNGRDRDPTDTGDRLFSSGLSTWHGTHVAAIVAAAADNGYGAVGIAPECRVMALRALGVGGGLVSDVADAILFAAGLFTLPDGRRLERPLRIANLSLGLDADSAELRDACERAAAVGVLLVGAAGNEGKRGLVYPAAYDTVMGVAAVGSDLNTTAYSNFGDDVELAAPGGVRTQDLGGDGWPDSILSAFVDETVHPPRAAMGYLQGTSQAAPHVAGVAALLLSVDPTLSRGDLRKLLLFTALDRGSAGLDDVYGRGIVQASTAVDQLLTDMGSPRTAPPELYLARSTLEFHGFETWHAVCVMNAGVDLLELFQPQSFTDDGADWLGATNVPLQGSLKTNVSEVIVTIDRSRVPAGAQRLSGTVHIRDATRTIGTIRVVLHDGVGLRAGMNHTVVAREPEGGGVRALALASPAFDYRYWFRSLVSGTFKVMSGTDVDGDGFICEGGDACGWYGGATEGEASLVDLDAQATVLGADVFLRNP